MPPPPPPTPDEKKSLEGDKDKEETDRKKKHSVLFVNVDVLVIPGRKTNWSQLATFNWYQLISTGINWDHSYFIGIKGNNRI